ncbi:hypothetical protein [Microvirga calopogonii]|uniref:hypothetical protein n=1 Tax=Microvirga calopogonii TaxID=2078013 RepID=UPI0013B3872A|nr:hypothetical protein [Microvirga calopogonii]
MSTPQAGLLHSSPAVGGNGISRWTFADAAKRSFASIGDDTHPVMAGLVPAIPIV